MTTIIEGIYKKGIIKPVEDIKLEDNTKVIITIKESKPIKSIMSFSGSWKDYKTFDGRTLDDVKKEIYRDREYSTRKDINLN